MYLENCRALELKVFTLAQENRRLVDKLRSLDPKCDVSYRSNGSPSNGSRSPSSSPMRGGPAKDFGQPGRIELLQENQRLSAEVSRLTKELAAARAAPVSSAPQAQSGESRLRALLTSRRTSTSELRSAIAGVEALLSEAKRELSNAELRERRAAYEQLHAAVVGEDNEEALAAMIEVAVAAGVDAEELEKASRKLHELRSLTPEQKLARANQKLEASRKQSAFLLVKKDDAKGLQELLDTVEQSGVRWQAWKDWSGRSLWRCAQELRSARVQIYLAPKLGLRTQEGTKRSSLHTLSERNAMAGLSNLSTSPSASPTISPIKEKEESVFEGSSYQPGGRRQSGDANESGTNGPFGAIGLGNLGWPALPEEAAPGKSSRLANALVTPRPPSRGDLLEQSPAAAVASAISNSEAASALITPRVSHPTPDMGTASNGWSPSTYSSSPVYSPANLGTSPAGNTSEPFADLKAKALRAVAQDDAVTLRTILDRVSSGIWSKWENKAGKDLITLSQERGSSLAYSLLARELGVLKELHREVFEEREAVWVFEVGEVQPRRATVLEDTPEEAEEIYVEFWDGDAPPTYVERCLVRKMA